MDLNKLAVILTSPAAEEQQTYQSALQNIRDFWSAGVPPFETMVLITPEGLEHAPLAEQKNHCLALAAENNAGWSLIRTPSQHLALKATDELEKQFADQQGLWGLVAGYLPEENGFSMKLPQVMKMDDFQELLFFDPLLTLSGPYFVRTDAALETGFNTDYPLAHDMEFALRFWARWNGRKAPVLIGGCLEKDFMVNEATREELAEVALAARQEIGLLRETPEIVEKINANIRTTQSYCRGKQAVEPEILPEITTLMPYKGLLDVTISPAHGFMLANDSDDVIADNLAWRGQYQPMKTAIWTVLAAQNPGLVFDCGAFNGFYGLVAATVSPESQVFCIEPEREAFARIVRNIKINNMRNLHAVQYALDIAPGLATLYRMEETENLCLNTSIHPHEPCPVQQGQPVHVVSLDSFLMGVAASSEEQQPPITLVKMDLCGLEYQALLGMGNTLYEQRPTLLLTLYPHSDTRGMEGLLQECGYDFYFLDEEAAKVSAFDTFPPDLRQPAAILATSLDSDRLAAQLESLQEE